MNTQKTSSTTQKSSSVSHRSEIGRSMGLGSAKRWTGHWFSVQLSALALIPLSLYLLVSFLMNVVPGGDYDHAVAWVRSPAHGPALILLLVIGIYYCASEMISGLVLDYVHDPVLHVVGGVVIKFGAALVLIDGVVAVLKIMFGT
jgi:succinate dehydrogenase / fumarate reductase, membrane anchor subunit